MENHHLDLEKRRICSEMTREKNAGQEINGKLQVKSEVLDLLREFRKN